MDDEPVKHSLFTIDQDSVGIEFNERIENGVIEDNFSGNVDELIVDADDDSHILLRRAGVDDLIIYKADIDLLESGLSLQDIPSRLLIQNYFNAKGLSIERITINGRVMSPDEIWSMTEQFPDPQFWLNRSQLTNVRPLLGSNNDMWLFFGSAEVSDRLSLANLWPLQWFNYKELDKDRFVTLKQCPKQSMIDSLEDHSTSTPNATRITSETEAERIHCPVTLSYNDMTELAMYTETKLLEYIDSLKEGSASGSGSGSNSVITISGSGSGNSNLTMEEWPVFIEDRFGQNLPDIIHVGAAQAFNQTIEIANSDRTITKGNEITISNNQNNIIRSDIALKYFLLAGNDTFYVEDFEWSYAGGGPGEDLLVQNSVTEGVTIDFDQGLVSIFDKDVARLHSFERLRWSAAVDGKIVTSEDLVEITIENHQGRVVSGAGGHEINFGGYGSLALKPVEPEALTTITCKNTDEFSSLILDTEQLGAPSGWQMKMLPSSGDDGSHPVEAWYSEQFSHSRYGLFHLGFSDIGGSGILSVDCYPQTITLDNDLISLMELGQRIGIDQPVTTFPTPAPATLLDTQPTATPTITPTTENQNNLNPVVSDFIPTEPTQPSSTPSVSTFTPDLSSEAITSQLYQMTTAMVMPPTSTTDSETGVDEDEDLDTGPDFPDSEYDYPGLHEPPPGSVLPGSGSEQESNQYSEPRYGESWINFSEISSDLCVAISQFDSGNSEGSDSNSNTDSGSGSGSDSGSATSYEEARAAIETDCEPLALLYEQTLHRDTVVDLNLGTIMVDGVQILHAANMNSVFWNSHDHANLLASSTFSEFQVGSNAGDVNIEATNNSFIVSYSPITVHVNINNNAHCFVEDEGNSVVIEFTDMSDFSNILVNKFQLPGASSDQPYSYQLSILSTTAETYNDLQHPLLFLNSVESVSAGETTLGLTQLNALVQATHQFLHHSGNAPISGAHPIPVRHQLYHQLVAAVLG